ncbi:hypothetical protein KR009_009631 [Drosophila setifemur]|nr:hypothetical protein KR009_009631 [Drosophila setifemur]
MTPKRILRGSSELRYRKGQSKEEHLRLIDELDLADSCCDICQCECYSSHGSSSVSDRGDQRKESLKELLQLDKKMQALEQLKLRESAKGRRSESVHRHISASKSPVNGQRREINSGSSTRSKSAGSPKSDFRHKNQQQQQELRNRPQHHRKSEVERDYKMRQKIMGPLNYSPALSANGRVKSKWHENMALDLLNKHSAAKKDVLRIASTVRAAFQQVPSHDQKILNRMAGKRSQQAVDKETAWLARKYWENERLERQMLRVEQLEAFKQAVHDKQFQDYLLTKARLQALAERDLAELRRLRGALDAKDAAAKQRLEDRRIERDFNLCQRRYEELRRCGVVTVQQEEQYLDETLRKRDICMKLTQRLRRADELRCHLLKTYLNRLQHDNIEEQTHHEELWRERQQEQRLRREQLCEDIQRKGHQSQLFVEGRQRLYEERFRAAKISSSLRELVRQSVTPEGGVGSLAGLDLPLHKLYSQQEVQIGRLLFKKSPRNQVGGGA